MGVPRQTAQEEARDGRSLAGQRPERPSVHGDPPGGDEGRQLERPRAVGRQEGLVAGEVARPEDVHEGSVVVPVPDRREHGAREDERHAIARQRPAFARRDLDDR